MIDVASVKSIYWFWALHFEVSKSGSIKPLSWVFTALRHSVKINPMIQHLVESLKAALTSDHDLSAFSVSDVVIGRF